MTHIHLKQVSSGILKKINLKIHEKELMVLVGSSGAGKSTLLNAIAGLIQYSGDIAINAMSVNHLQAYQRKVGYVLQDLYLFPHISVKKNILLSMKNLPYSKTEKKRKSAYILELFKLEKLAARKPSELSGGEKQLTAMARALAFEPEILLLDEPFGHLDFKTARYMRTQFKYLHQHLGITTLFVTHDLKEARELGHRIALMENGMIGEINTPDSFKSFPDNVLSVLPYNQAVPIAS